MVIDQLKEDKRAFSKARKTVERDLLGTLIGDIEKECGNKKEVTDAICIKFIKKFVGNAEDNIRSLGTRGEADSDYAALYKAEAELLSQYLPRQMSVVELTKAVQAILDGLPPDQFRIGPVMGQLKNKFAGLYDGKVAKGIIEGKI